MAKKEQISPSEVIVKKNFRKEFEIEDLKESMSRIGLLQPIVITEDKILVAGERRLRAAKALGWETIDYVIRNFADEDDQIAAGIFENLKRETFTDSEQMKALAWLKKNWQEDGVVSTKKDTGRGKNKDTCRPNFAEKIEEESGGTISASTAKDNVRLGEKMTNEVAEALDSQSITKKQALELIKIDDHDKQNELLSIVQGKNLGETREIVSQYLAGETEKAITIEGFVVDRWIHKVIERMNGTLAILEVACEKKVWTLSAKSGPKFIDSLRELNQKIAELCEATTESLKVQKLASKRRPTMLDGGEQ